MFYFLTLSVSVFISRTKIGNYISMLTCNQRFVSMCCCTVTTKVTTTDWSCNENNLKQSRGGYTSSLGPWILNLAEVAVLYLKVELTDALPDFLCLQKQSGVGLWGLWKIEREKIKRLTYKNTTQTHYSANLLRLIWNKIKICDSCVC